MSVWYQKGTCDTVISPAMSSCDSCTDYVWCVYAIIRVIEQTYFSTISNDGWIALQSPSTVQSCSCLCFQADQDKLWEMSACHCHYLSILFASIHVWPVNPSPHPLPLGGFTLAWDDGGAPTGKLARDFLRKNPKWNTVKIRKQERSRGNQSINRMIHEWQHSHSSH